MDKIVGISDRTNAALHALALAECNGGTIAAGVAAKRLGLSPTYLAKILQHLAAKGVVGSVRGIGGGFSLLKPASEMICMEVLEALDGPLPTRYCLFPKAVCATRTCAFHTLCVDVETILVDTLKKSTVADIAAAFACGGPPTKALALKD
jgi:Rrf2 family protein